MKFDKSDSALSFLSCVGERVRFSLTRLDIFNLTKTTALPMMMMLSECKHIQRVHIIGGVGTNSLPEKAARVFYSDAYRFLQTMGSLRGDRFAGLDLLSFGKKCFVVKEGTETRMWTEDEIDEFTDALKGKL